MVKIAVTGSTGRMGKEIIAAISTDVETILTTALVRPGHALVGTKVVATMPSIANAELTFVETIAMADDCDVIIDFTTPAATIGYIAQGLRLLRPMVIGTTGLSNVEKQQLQQAAVNIPIVFAPNMSIGVNVCYKLIALGAATLGSNWQVAISELHHKAKKDAPSGTALKMGEIIVANSGLENTAIQFNSIRAGDIIGEHTVLFVGDGERIAITHSSTNRQAFAKGAIAAAKWVLGKSPGLYTMQDVIQG